MSRANDKRHSLLFTTVEKLTTQRRPSSLNQPRRPEARSSPSRDRPQHPAGSRLPSLPHLSLVESAPLISQRSPKIATSIPRRRISRNRTKEASIRASPQLLHAHLHLNQNRSSSSPRPQTPPLLPTSPLPIRNGAVKQTFATAGPDRRRPACNSLRAPLPMQRPKPCSRNSPTRQYPIPTLTP